MQVSLLACQSRGEFISMAMDTAPPTCLIALWQLSSPAFLAETPRAALWRVSLTDGGNAVLKVARPDTGGEEANAAAVLRHWQGTGAVKVLAERPGALLLEYLPGPSAGDLARSGNDDSALEALLSVAARLHSTTGTPPNGLVSLHQWCQILTDRPILPDVAKSLLERAATLAENLLKTAPSSRLLHGDLHHDNVLLGPRGWCAIDPKGLWGDPAFDMANCFRNPEGLGAALHDPLRIVRIASRTQAALGHPRARLLGWAAVQCALSICWDTEQGAAQSDDLALLPVLLALAEE